MHGQRFLENENVISTQEMIQDARERRKYNVKQFNCEDCNYKSSSITLLKNHIRIHHNKETSLKDNDQDILEMPKAKIRQRFACKTCSFKTTNDETLKTHVESNHLPVENQNKKEKSNSKRIHCQFCEKKFNKMETFDKHMKAYHKKNQQPVIPSSSGRSNQQNMELEGPSRATSTTKIRA